MSELRVFSADDVDRYLEFEPLIDALHEAFKTAGDIPPRHHHTIDHGGSRADQTLLLMPAWNDEYIVTKLVAVTPDNGALALPAVMASVIVMDAKTGRQMGLIDGARLTLWRTSAASALAARFLAPPTPETLLMIGAGKLAPFLIKAHCSVRSYQNIQIWNRNAGSAASVSKALADEGYNVTVVDDLDAAVANADVISAATLSNQPLIKGALLKDGCHVDLVGAFTPKMRESDDDCVRRADVFVDTMAGALKEGGDLVQPIEAGVISRQDIKGDLHSLTQGLVAGRSTADQITLFKSTGASLEDLAAASLFAKRAKLQS